MENVGVLVVRYRGETEHPEIECSACEAGRVASARAVPLPAVTITDVDGAVITLGLEHVLWAEWKPNSLVTA